MKRTPALIRIIPILLLFFTLIFIFTLKAHAATALEGGIFKASELIPGESYTISGDAIINMDKDLEIAPLSSTGSVSIEGSSRLTISGQGTLLMAGAVSISKASVTLNSTDSDSNLIIADTITLADASVTARGNYQTCLVADTQTADMGRLELNGDSHLPILITRSAGYSGDQDQLIDGAGA